MNVKCERRMEFWGDQTEMPPHGGEWREVIAVMRSGTTLSQGLRGQRDLWDMGLHGMCEAALSTRMSCDEGNVLRCPTWLLSIRNVVGAAETLKLHLILSHFNLCWPSQRAGNVSRVSPKPLRGLPDSSSGVKDIPYLPVTPNASVLLDRMACSVLELSAPSLTCLGPGAYVS